MAKQPLNPPSKPPERSPSADKTKVMPRREPQNTSKVSKNTKMADPLAGYDDMVRANFILDPYF